MSTHHRGACEAFALCRNATEHVHLHALLGPVPTCERCAARLGVQLYPATDDMAAIYADFWDYRQDAESGPFPERHPLSFSAWAADPVLCDLELLAAAKGEQ